MPDYYTYKDEVPLLPGQRLAFSAGRGYYAEGTPTPSQTTKETTRDSPSIEQPIAAPKPQTTQPQASNASQVARETTQTPPTIDRPVSTTSPSSATPAPSQPAPSGAAQAARNTTAAPPTIEQPISTITSSKTASKGGRPSSTNVDSATNTPSAPTRAEAATSPSTPLFTDASTGGYRAMRIQPAPSLATGPDRLPAGSTTLDPVQPTSRGTDIPPADAGTVERKQHERILQDLAGERVTASASGALKVSSQPVKFPGFSLHSSFGLGEPLTDDPFKSSGYSTTATSPTGQLLFGITPRHDPAPTKHGVSFSAKGLRDVQADVIPVTASDIRLIAALPHETLDAIAGLLDNPDELVRYGIAFAAERSKAVAVASTVATFLENPTKTAAKALLGAYVQRKFSDATKSLEDNAVRSAFGEGTPELLNAIQTALTVASIAAAVRVAKHFEDEFKNALRDPEGKHFLLNLEYIFTPEPTAGGQPPGSTATLGSPRATFAGTTPAEIGATRLGSGPSAAGQPAAGSSAPVIRVATDLQPFLYWWTGK